MRPYFRRVVTKTSSSSIRVPSVMVDVAKHPNPVSLVARTSKDIGYLAKVLEAVFLLSEICEILVQFKIY